MGQLIDAESPDEAPGRRDAGVAFDLEQNMVVAVLILRAQRRHEGVSVDHHGAQLEALKDLTVSSDPTLTEKHRPSVVSPDSKGAAGEEG